MSEFPPKRIFVDPDDGIEDCIFYCNRDNSREVEYIRLDEVISRIQSTLLQLTIDRKMRELASRYIEEKVLKQ